MTFPSKFAWLQPWAINPEDIEKYAEQTFSDALFIWDLEQFARLGIGEKRQAFIYQYLMQLDCDVWLIEGKTSDILQRLAGAELHVLEPMHGVGADFAEPESVVVQRYQPKELVPFEQPIPYGYFKFWKAAEKHWQLRQKGRAHQSSATS